ncbi:transposase [Streptomyces carpinensis]|uniref:Transposase n=1 Tax=Streptomyces carpinensis TaxID=66369 RepID=A0ABV1W130_9ACTN|nr:transposase [Streptomyces carpinensis]
MESFEKRPDAEIITGFPEFCALSGARGFAGIGDDRSGFADAKGLRAHAGSAPIARASGKSVAVLARRVQNQRLAGVGYVWAFAAMAHSEGARAHYPGDPEDSPQSRQAVLSAPAEWGVIGLNGCWGWVGTDRSGPRGRRWSCCSTRTSPPTTTSGVRPTGCGKRRRSGVRCSPERPVPTRIQVLARNPGRRAVFRCAARPGRG